MYGFYHQHQGVRQIHTPATLTNCIGDLLCIMYHPAIQSLEELDLSNSRLTKVDLKDLNKALNGCELPKMKKLNLSRNRLTACVEELFDTSGDHGFSA